MQLPYKINPKIEWLMILLIIFNIAFGLYIFNMLPDQIPTHWDMHGNPDQYSGKAFGSFFIPGLLAFIYLLMTFLPLADPKKDRYKDFSKAYTVIRLILVIYLTAIYWASSAYALGVNINIADFSTISIGVLFLIIGNFMPKLKPTWFVGIRTPWTLSDETVWYKTHRLGGKMFLLGGLIILALTLFPTSIRWIVFMAVVFAVVIVTFVYSWWIWRKQDKTQPPANPN